MKCLSFVFVLAYSSLSWADSCLDRYKKMPSDYAQEIALLEEIDRNFSEYTIVEVADILLSNSLFHLKNMNQFVRAYGEAYCKVKDAPTTQCFYRYHEMMILLVAHARNGNFCPGEELYSMNDIITNFFLVPSGVSLLDEFRVFEASSKIEVRELYNEFLNGMSRDAIETILEGFAHSTQGKNQGFIVNGRFIYVPVQGIQGSMLGNMLDSRYGVRPMNDLGNAYILEVPEGFSKEEFEEGFTLIAQALYENKKQDCNDGKVRELVKYFQLNSFCRPTDDEQHAAYWEFERLTEGTQCIAGYDFNDFCKVIETCLPDVNKRLKAINVRTINALGAKALLEKLVRYFDNASPSDVGTERIREDENIKNIKATVQKLAHEFRLELSDRIY